jgi:hypothetical protein
MTQMSCPSCGLTLTFRQQENERAEPCPRCLARSSGAMSIRLRPGVPPKPLGAEKRVREFLRKQGLSRAATG